MIENLFSFLWNYDIAYGHILQGSSCTIEWRISSGIISRFDIDVTSSWWRSRTARGACSFWIDPLKLDIIAFFRTLTPWWFCYKSTPLLVMNLKPFVKVVTRLRTFISSHGLQFFTLDTIICCEIRFVNCFLIAKQTT